MCRINDLDCRERFLKRQQDLYKKMGLCHVCFISSNMNFVRWVFKNLVSDQKYVGYWIRPRFIKIWMMKKTYAWKTKFDLTKTKVVIDSKALTLISEFSLHFHQMTAIILKGFIVAPTHIFLQHFPLYNSREKTLRCCNFEVQ